ncbi:MAG: Cna B-type domain-containing protein, partial [Acidaminococcaceae bacterium]|nr:Cna B-type domain-containing protein [Acidaminococcaceae bacterium]
MGESFYAGKSDLVINVSPPDGYISKDDTGELIDICCRKIWEDDDNLAGKRPERVTVFLVKEGDIYRSLDLT